MTRRGAAGGRPEGSGPGGRITPEDIRASAEELAGGVGDQVQAKLPARAYLLAGGAALLVLASFYLGRRSGRRRSTVVEIRRG